MNENLSLSPISFTANITNLQDKKNETETTVFFFDTFYTGKNCD